MFKFVVVVRFGRTFQNPVCFTDIMKGGSIAAGSATLAGARRTAQLFGAENVFVLRGATYNKLYRK